MSDNWGGARAGAGRKSYAHLKHCHELIDQAGDDQAWRGVFAYLFATAQGQSQDGEPVKRREAIEAAKLIMRYRYGMLEPEPPHAEDEVEPIRLIEIRPSCMREAKNCPYQDDPSTVYDSGSDQPVAPDDPILQKVFHEDGEDDDLPPCTASSDCAAVPPPAPSVPLRSAESALEPPSSPSSIQNPEFPRVPSGSPRFRGVPSSSSPTPFGVDPGSGLPIVLLPPHLHRLMGRVPVSEWGLEPGYIYVIPNGKRIMVPRPAP